MVRTMSRRQFAVPERPDDHKPDDDGCPILHVDMDAFYASASLLSRPELKGTPVIIGGGGNRGVVLSATYEARAFGVASAMPIARARRLCPQAAVVAPDYARYERISQAVMAVFASVTPIVEPLSMDEAFLDVSGARRRLGTGPQIAQQIRDTIADEQGITCSVVPTHRERSIGADETFSYDVDDPAYIRRELLKLSDRTAARVRAAGMVGRTVTVKVRFSDFTTITRSRTLRDPTDVSRDIFATALSLFDGLGLQRARLRLVGVRVTGLMDSDQAPIQGLLDEPEHGWRDADRAVDRASARFGAGAVGPASLVQGESSATTPMRGDIS